ncbi:MAG: aminoglycoside phosphotransferase [Ketobacter sp.]|nr:MAG: aminoglycoside phosphotransferase [Ketobacter sp.]
MQQDWMSSIQFPHATHNIEWRETHISQILLTGEWVYKIKKPVDFGFLDFSTLAKRKHFCEEELRLNQRSAPELYVSVEALCRDDQGYNFCGRGEVIDYAVKMKQFDPESLLLNRMQEVSGRDGFFQTLGYTLAQFHSTAAVSGANEEFGNPESVRFPVEENFRQILPHLSVQTDKDRLEGITAWSQGQSEKLTPVFVTRKQQGMVRECHGDLHLANIALIHDKPVMFDCIEFNERFRWIDVASDLAFLLMDMEFHGYSLQANILLNSYLEYSGDYELLKVLTYYKVYRALVRAKVAVLRMEQAQGDEAEALLQQFRQHLSYAERSFQSSQKYLAITCGVSGSGKSTLARKLAAQSGAVHLRSDVIRKQIAGLKPLESSVDLDPDNPDALYSKAYTVKTFDHLQTLAETILSMGYPVIVDATFLKALARTPFQMLAEKLGVPFKILYMNVPEPTLVERILQRQSNSQDASEAGVEVMKQQLLDWEPFLEGEKHVVVRVGEDLPPISSLHQRPTDHQHT